MMTSMLFLLFLSLYPVYAIDTIEFTTNPLIIPNNFQPGDEIIGDHVFRAVPTNDEDIALMVVPSSDSVVIAPSIVQPGGIFQIFVKDLESLKQTKEYKIQALGLISGYTQEVPMNFQFMNGRSKLPSSNEKLEFEKETYDFELDSDQTEKQIGSIRLISGEASNYQVELLGDLSSHFSLKTDLDNIIINSIQCMDCNLPEQFTLMLVVSNQGSSDKAVINFTSQKKSEFQFLQKVYDTEVEEEAPIFKKIVKLRTNVDDEVVYSLEDVSGLFAVHPTTGILSIQHPEFLNTETVGKSVNITAIARSADQKTSTTIQIKVVPKTESQHFKFQEESYSFNVPAGERSVGNVTIPVRQTTEYRISEGDSRLFTVNEGNIMFTGEFPKETKMFQLLVLGQSTSAPFSVDVVPVIVNIAGIGSNGVLFEGDSSRLVKLPASSNPGSALLSLNVIDKDEDSTIEFSMDNLQLFDSNGQLVKTESKPLKLRENGKNVVLHLKNSIMDQELSRMTVNIIARDTAHPQEPNAVVNVELFVVRTETMKKTPVPFKILQAPNAIILKPDAAIGSFVYQVHTSHPSSAVVYKFPKNSDQFEINSASGIISVKSKLNPGSRNLLNVMAVEGNQKTEGLIVVEVTSDETALPKFKNSEYNVTVPSSTPIGQTVLTVNLERNMPDVIFTILGSNYFGINEKGDISLILPFGNDTMDHAFVVEAKTTTGKSMTEVFAKIAPSEDGKILMFPKSNYTVEVMDDIPLNSFVYKVQVENHDDTVHYSIEEENPADRTLDIDHEGKITIRNEIKEKSLGIFKIKATKDSQTAYADLILKSQNSFSCVPEFKSGLNEVFSITENSDVGTVIGHVTTEPINVKCNLSYHFWDTMEKKLTQDTDFATIDSETGEMKSLRVFDFEKNRNYQLILALKAGGRMITQMSSELVINDADDHPLKLDFYSVTVEIPESNPIGTIVTTVKAMEPDASQQIFYRLKYDSEHFSVKEDTGEVMLIKSLDREDEDRFEMMVGASNNPSENVDDITEWCTVIVVVKDVNDNGPLFERGKYEIVLDKMELPGKELLTVHAEDPDLSDETPNSVFYFAKETTFEYKGLKRSVDGIFHVNQQTGEIRLEETVNEFVGGVFHLLLEATDSLEPRYARKDTAVLKVYIHDSSDVIGSQIEKSPIELKSNDVSDLLQSVANATGLKVLLKDVKYQHLEQSLIHDATDVQMIVVNKTSSEVIPAEKVLAILNKIQETNSLTNLKLRKSYQSYDGVTHASTSPLFYFILIFVLLLCCVCAIFGLMLCFYRSGYRKERKLHEDSLVIANTLNRSKHRPFSLTPIQTSPTLNYRDDEYSVQERKMSVT